MIYGHMGNENQDPKPQQEDDSIPLMLLCVGLASLLIIYILNLN